MKVSIAMDNFPVKSLSALIQELSKHIGSIDVQVGGEDTVYVSFFSDDIDDIINHIENYVHPEADITRLRNITQ